MRYLCALLLTISLVQVESTYASSKLNQLEESHGDAARIWARTLSEASYISLRVEQYKAAFEKRLRGIMRRQEYPSWLRLFDQTSFFHHIFFGPKRNYVVYVCSNLS